MARDRKRAKQRQQRRSAAASGGSARGRGSNLTRADLPGSLEHVGDVDEFDAALVRGADGVPATPEALPEPLPQDSKMRPGEDLRPRGEELRSGGESAGNGIAAPPARVPARPAEGRQPLPSRAMAFVRSSWAELQRVQWPDRRQVTQATAVVLGFVAVAGIYFGVADYVAKEIVEAIL